MIACKEAFKKIDNTSSAQTRSPLGATIFQKMKTKTRLMLSVVILSFLLATMGTFAKQLNSQVAEGVAMATQAALSMGKILPATPR